MKFKQVLAIFLTGTILNFIVNLKAISQTEDYCYLVTVTGKYINLSSVCKTKKRKKSRSKFVKQSELDTNSSSARPAKNSHYGQPIKKYFRD